MTVRPVPDERFGAERREGKGAHDQPVLGPTTTLFQYVENYGRCHHHVGNRIDNPHQGQRNKELFHHCSSVLHTTTVNDE